MSKKKVRRKKALGSVHQLLGKEIRKHRKVAGMTQTQLAKRAGSTQPQISHYERAVDPLPIPVLFRVSEVLKVPLCELFGQDHP